jgi:hypothetical protein
MIARVLLLVLALGGCVQAEAPDRNACGAAGMQGLVGQGREVLAAMTVPMGTRVIEPGMPVTEDYSASRLNIEFGVDGRIARVWCG